MGYKQGAVGMIKFLRHFGTDRVVTNLFYILKKKNMQIIIVYVLDVYIITICYVNMVSSEFNFAAPSPIMSNYEDFIEFRKFIYNTIIDFANINEQLVTTFMDSYVTIHIYVW